MNPIIRYNEAQSEIDRILSRSQLDMESERCVVRDIVSAVRRRGDEALFEYTQMFDQCVLCDQTIRVSEAEIRDAYTQVDKALIDILRRAADNIRAFHQRQMENTWMQIEDGRTVGQMIQPIERAGVYIPGGRAAYPSSVLMNVLPASVAGVERIVLTTPPDHAGRVSPITLVAASVAGCDEIYKAGGAQAIAALAFGTHSIPRVDKITGPGSVYVSLAKREVFGYVGIDMFAGPSEILIIADCGADARFIAADLLSQAEHDPLAAAIFITVSESLAQLVQQEIQNQLNERKRREIIAQSLHNYGAVIVVDNLSQAAELSNRIAPEHLELMVRDPIGMLGSIRNAGAIFMGDYTPEPVGDYYAGPNHTLPTSGTSRFFSPLSVDDFMKKTSLLYYNREALRKVKDDVQAFAEAEGLDAHAASVAMRFE